MGAVKGAAPTVHGKGAAKKGQTEKVFKKPILEPVSEEENDNASDVPVKVDSDSDEDHGPYTQKFIDDTEAAEVAPGYESDPDAEGDMEVAGSEDDDDDNAPTSTQGKSGSKRKRLFEDSDEPYKAVADSVQPPPKVKKLAADWGKAIDLTRKGAGPTKLKSREPFGPKYILDGNQEIWTEFRIFTSEGKGKKKKRGLSQKEEKMINVIIGRKYVKKEDGTDGMFQYNVPVQHVPGVIEGLKVTLENLTAMGYYEG